MGPLSRERFEALLGRRSQREIRQFIADLYAARGWETSVDGEHVHAVRGTREQWLAFGSADEDEDAPTGTRRLESDDVYLMALYSIDRRTCNDLCREHFDRPFLVTRDSPVARVKDWTWVTAALVLLLVAGGLVAAGSGWFGPADVRRPSDPPPAASRNSPTDDQAWPRGVTEAGVEDGDALATAHQRALQREGYVLVSNRTVRYPNGTVRSRVALRVRLAPNRTYLARVAIAGDSAPRLLGKPPARATFWSNGSSHIRRFTRANETTYNTFVPPVFVTWGYWVRTVAFGGHGDNPRTFYSAVFRAVPTRLDSRSTANGTRYYRLVDDGAARTKNPVFTGAITGVRNVSLAATVDQRGIVRTFRLQYTGRVDENAVRVRWIIRYRAVGKTTVARPPWFERAVSSGTA